MRACHVKCRRIICSTHFFIVNCVATNESIFAAQIAFHAIHVISTELLRLSVKLVDINRLDDNKFYYFYLLIQKVITFACNFGGKEVHQLKFPFGFNTLHN